MTAPRGAALLGALASPTVVVDTMRAEARQRHEDYKRHVLLESHNSSCRGRLCLRGQRLLDEADDAGKRLLLAEERERGAR